MFYLDPSRPVLERLGEVDRADLRRAGQVGDRVGQLEHAVVAARGKLQLAHGDPHQLSNVRDGIAEIQ